MYFFMDLKSDFRSSFKGVEKNIFDKKLETTAGLRPDKIKEIYCN